MTRKLLAAISTATVMAAVPHFNATIQGADAPRIELLSITTNGLVGSGPSGADTSSPEIPHNKISANGRYVIFESFASNLVCSDTNFSSNDVFVRDRLTGITTLVSVAWDGAQGNTNSYDATISADGRYVAFGSAATNMVPGDTNGFEDIFVRDLLAGTTKRVSVSTAGEQGNSVAHGPAISGDGRYVAFYSNATNLVAGDVNNTWDVFVRDTVSDTTVRISAEPGETFCCGGDTPSISDDGRYVAFMSQSRLDPAHRNNFQQIYVHDMVTGTNAMAGLSATGAVPQNAIFRGGISPDGRHVVFQSNSNDIVFPDANGFTHDVFLRDLDAGTTTLISQSSAGVQGNADAFMPSVSRDGRYVAFYSWSNNLVPGDTSTGVQYDVFVRDTLANTTTRVNVGMGGLEANGHSEAPSISQDGSVVYFQSTGTNLVPADTNGVQDVFLYAPPYPGAIAPGFGFDAAAYNTAENAGSATVTVYRNGSTCSTATVQYATSDGTAAAGADYTAASGTLTFLPGETSHSFTIPILDDTQYEPNETIYVSLQNASGGVPLGSLTSAVVTVADNDPTPNGPPIGVNDGATTNEDTPVTVAVLMNDTDPENDPIAVASFTPAAHGSVADNGGGGLTYTPALNYFGGDAFTYTIADGHGGTATATVNVTVLPMNDPPIALDDAYGMSANSSLVIAAPGVLANDTDVDNPVLTAAVFSGPANGAVALNPAGTFTYTPFSGFTGTDSFTYFASDGSTASNPATVTIVVTGLTMTPVVGTTTPIPGGVGTFTGFPAGPGFNAGAAFFLGAGNGGQIGLYSRGGAPTAPPIKLADLATPIPGGTGAFTSIGEFSPAGQPGDPCRWAVFVGAGAGGQQGIYLSPTCSPGQPSAPPIRISDLWTVIPAGQGTFTSVALPKLVAIPGDPCREMAFVGSGPGGQQGIYMTSSCDAGGPTPPPIRIVDVTSQIPGGTGTFASFAHLDLIATPGDPCRKAAFVGAGTGAQQGVYLASGCKAGVPEPPPIRLADTSTLIPGGQGTFSGFGPLAAAPVLAPDPPPIRVAFIGEGAASQQGVYTVASIGVPSAAPIKIADRATAIPQGQGTFTNFVAVSASGDHTAFLATGPGGQKGVYLASTLTKVVSLTDRLDGKAIVDLRFASDGLSATDLVFTAVFADGSEAVYHVTVDYPGANDSPVAIADSYSVNEDGVLNVAAPGILVNDADPEGGALTLLLVSNPAHGTLSLNADGSFAYAPAADFNGTDGFTYKVIDPGGLESAVVPVTIVVSLVNDLPVAVGDSYRVNQGAVLTVQTPGVLLNDHDIDSPGLTASVVTGPANGAVVVAPNGSFTYTPNAAFRGVDSFTYKANDGLADSSPATVTIMVDPVTVNRPPVANNDGYSVKRNTLLLIPAPGVLANDTDPDSTVVLSFLIRAASHGIALVFPNGALLYIPAPLFVGTDSFSYRATDGVGVSNTATVTINVTR